MTTLEYVQSPACGYDYTTVFTWDSGTTSFIEGDSAGLLKVHSILPTEASDSPFNMAVSAVVTIVDNNGVANAEFTVADTVTFDVEITNPCATATITALSFTPASPTVVDGESVYTEWNTPTSSVDETHSNTVGGFCGPVTYELFNTDADETLTTAYGVEWAVIS